MSTLERSPRLTAADETESVTRTVTLAPDRQLTYATYGDPDGRPIVFLHGTPGSRRLGALLDATASRAGVRVLAPDRPGYGRSTPWPERSVRDAPSFLTPVLDDAGVETAGIVAFSGGAPTALAMAATRPERVDRVDLVSGAVPPAVEQDTPAVQRLLAGLATRAPVVLRGLFRGQAWLVRRRDPSFVVAQYTATGPASVPDDVAALVRADFIEAVARSRRGAVTEFRHAAQDWGIALDEIETPVHLWHGSRDTNVPLDGVERLADRLPTARLHRRKADHLGTLLRSHPDVLRAHGPPGDDSPRQNGDAG